jgi:hypothetical protein
MRSHETPGAIARTSPGPGGMATGKCNVPSIETILSSVAD